MLVDSIYDPICICNYYEEVEWNNVMVSIDGDGDVAQSEPNEFFNHNDDVSPFKLSCELLGEIMAQDRGNVFMNFNRMLSFSAMQ